MNRKNNSKNKGYIALVTVMAIGMASLFYIVGAFAIAVENTKSILVLEDGVQARMMTNTCGESALKSFRLDNTYPGDETILLGNNSCYIYLVETTPTGVVMKIEGYANQTTRRVQIDLNEISTNVYESWWREVDDF